MAGIEIRPATPEELPRIAQIQAAVPQAGQWNPEDYLAHDVLVAFCEDRMAGFAVARDVAAGESELLNLAVDPEFRRRGAGRKLVTEVLGRHPGEVWLEVRESNRIALKFYESIGFMAIGRRPRYYLDPLEDAIVMKIHSC